MTDRVDLEELERTPKSEVDLIRLRIGLENAREHLSAAYWVSDEASRSFHKRYAAEQLHKVKPLIDILLDETFTTRQALTGDKHDE